MVREGGGNSILMSLQLGADRGEVLSGRFSRERLAPLYVETWER